MAVRRRLGPVPMRAVRLPVVSGLTPRFRLPRTSCIASGGPSLRRRLAACIRRARCRVRCRRGAFAAGTFLGEIVSRLERLETTVHDLETK